MALLSSVEKVTAEQDAAPRYADVIAWTTRDGWRVVLGLGITAWGIVSSLYFLR